MEMVPVNERCMCFPHGPLSVFVIERFAVQRFILQDRERALRTAKGERCTSSEVSVTLEVVVRAARDVPFRK